MKLFFWTFSDTFRTDRQTDRQTDIQTDRPTDRQTDIVVYREVTLSKIGESLIKPNFFYTSQRFSSRNIVFWFALNVLYTGSHIEINQEMEISPLTLAWFFYLQIVYLKLVLTSAERKQSLALAYVSKPHGKYHTLFNSIIESGEGDTLKLRRNFRIVINNIFCLIPLYACMLV